MSTILINLAPSRPAEIIFDLAFRDIVGDMVRERDQAAIRRPSRACGRCCYGAKPRWETTALSGLSPSRVEVSIAHVSRRLEILESAVQKGLEGAGKALRTIHDNKLYKERGFTSFAAYCDRHLGMSRAHAYRLMNAVRVRERLSGVADGLSESQLRELSPLADLDEHAAAEVMRELRSQHPTLCADND